MEKEDQKNFILALVLMVGFLWVYQTFIVDPKVEAKKAAEAAQQEQIATAPEAPITAIAPKAETVAEALAEGQSKRVAFKGDKVQGSINLVGTRIDDLLLNEEKIAVDSDESIRLFRPENAPNGFYAAYGWFTNEGYITNQNTEWVLESSGDLTPSTPISLSASRSGISIDRKIALDENYMFTITDTVTNTSGQERTLKSRGIVRRYGETQDFLIATDPKSNPRGEMLAHQGLIGILNNKLSIRKYTDLGKGKTMKGSTDGAITSDEGGWIGLTDKYWMGVLIPDQELAFTASSRHESLESGDELQIATSSAGIKLASGESRTFTNRIFAGAKHLETLKAYETDLAIPRFDDAIDWGMFYFLTKPFYNLIIWLKGFLGSFGLAILGFTVLVKLVLFPLYNKSYRSMAKMKKLSEPMKEIRERFAADRQRQQQEIMKLYKETGANPVAGCLPILATIPIFFALYKTLYVTIEMRHESFLWLKDLSAPDPTALLNGFGLLGGIISAETLKGVPVAGIVLGIGALPILYGLTMWGMQSLNPPPDDPVQRRIFAFLPVIFTFVFAGFAGGLVLYFVWNNILTLIQQYTIMRRQGVETQFDKFLAKRFGKKEGA